MKKLFSFFLALFFLGGVIFIFQSDFWRVKRIECQVNGSNCLPELWAGLMNEAGGKNLLFLSGKKICLKIQKKFPEVYELEMKKRLPQTLDFKIVIRKPVAIIEQEEGGKCLVDKDGYFLKGSVQIVGLPRALVGKKSCHEFGKKIEDQSLLTGIRLLYEGQIRLLEPKELRIVSPRAVEIKFKDDLEVLFSTQKETVFQLDSLQFILDRTKIEGSRPKRIDLRFDKPIIVE